MALTIFHSKMLLEKNLMFDRKILIVNKVSKVGCSFKKINVILKYMIRRNLSRLNRDSHNS